MHSHTLLLYSTSKSILTIFFPKFVDFLPDTCLLLGMLFIINNFFKTKHVQHFDKDQQTEKGNGFFFNKIEFIHHSNLNYAESGFYRLSSMQKVALFLLMLTVVTSLILDWHNGLIVLVSILTLLYFADLLFNLFLIFRSFANPIELKITQNEINSLDEKKLPRYTIFCPLYQEWQVVPQFIAAISRLDYPKDKLEVMLIMESDDFETIAKVGTYKLPEYFKKIIVPDSLPKTKPKALNYALQYASGEYAVVYDAEDIPSTDQLKKTVIAFTKVDKKTTCIQAKLNFYNPHQNILTRIFTAEYSLWFDLILTGLQSIKAPIPLGGTSNHFRKEDLKTLKGWDSFNVTEDCDLGIRIVKYGYRTAIIDSDTFEEANSDVLNWFNQRSRWIKGYIQTYLVHMRNPLSHINDTGYRNFIAFQLVVGCKVLSMFINPFMWIITISYFALRPLLGEFIESFFPTIVLYLGVISLFLGNFLYMYYYAIGCAKRGHWDLVKYTLVVPIYWLFISIAAWKALFQLIHKPHFWPKTKHGYHLKNSKDYEHAKKVIGNNLIDSNYT